MSLPLPTTEMPPRRYPLWLLPGYLLLAVVGVLTNQQIFSLLALSVLLTALMWPRLLGRQLRGWLVWLGALGVLGLLWRYRLADLLLEAVPLLVSALLAYGFGRTLATAEPLVARFIVVLEGPERLAQPGVARYARQVTWYWTLLLSGQALLLSILLVAGRPAGPLARFGASVPWHFSERLAAGWLHFGGYLLILAAFALEYAYRRWHLRHLEHLSPRQTITQLIRHWPQLVGSRDSVAS
ncbi:MAG: xanthomonadin biosynthesis protein [Rhodanobacter sp.]|nr:MAG: xanthomonadin biosynthesis protein [Rhodanobacter sp.]